MVSAATVKAVAFTVAVAFFVANFVSMKTRIKASERDAVLYRAMASDLARLESQLLLQREMLIRLNEEAEEARKNGALHLRLRLNESRSQHLDNSTTTW